MSNSCELVFDSLSVSVRPGVHWCGSFLRETAPRSHVSYTERGTAITPNASSLHSRVVDIDAKLLESGSAFAPHRFGGVECVARLVGLHLFANPVHSLAQSFPCG